MRAFRGACFLAALALCFQGVSWGQFQNQKPSLLQPRTSQQVVVPAAPLSGFDFDWTDVPGATHYELMVTRLSMGNPVGTVTATISHALYDSVDNPLEAGTEADPTQYSWQVVAYQGETASMPSDVFTFGLIGGTTLVPPKPGIGSNPLPAPNGLSPIAGVQYTPAVINLETLIMRWNPVGNAVGYEVQLVRSRNENGDNVNSLHYRLDVVSPQAVVSNITLLGEYRYEVRPIKADGSRGEEASETFNVVGALASDIYPDTPDLKIDEFDLFTLARNWHYMRENAPNPRADIVSADRIIEQADLIAFLIQFHNAPLRFPPPRPTPTPQPLAPAQLNQPEPQAMLALNTPADFINFSWDPVPNAAEYTLVLRNETTSQSEFFFPTTNTEQSVTGSQFLSLLGGSGNYTWEILADAPGFIQSQSGQRPFSLVLNFSKSGKAPSKQKSGWIKWMGEALFGSGAEAGTVPKGDIGTPMPVFPFSRQCMDSTSAFPLIWTEVEGATSYALEITLSTLFLTTFQGQLDEEKLNIIVDDVVGDGYVSALFFFTFPSDNYNFRVQARIDGARGAFSQQRRFEIRSVCDRPFIDIDYNDDGVIDIRDFYAYSRFWGTNKSSFLFDPLADLGPAKPDNRVNGIDMPVFLGVFQNRADIPVSIPLPPPNLLEPPTGTFYGPEVIGVPLHFTWEAVDHEFSDPLVYELELTQPATPPATPVVKRFIVNVLELTTQSLLQGEYNWRVRAIAQDGTRGYWSETRTFFIEIDEYQPDLPVPMSPIEDLQVNAGEVEFEYSRVTRIGPYAVFDRLEIQNEGGGPIVGLDIYHKRSEESQPTVRVKVPLAPNFGPDFRWRVRTYYVIRDSFFRLYFNGPVTVPEWSEFTLSGDKTKVTGLGAWNPDVNRNGKVDAGDGGAFQDSWRRERNGSPEYNQEVDFDLNGKVDIKDLLLFVQSGTGNRRAFLDNGGPVQPLNLIETPGVTPPTIPPPQRGLSVSWAETHGYTRYLLEWMDAQNRMFALYADKLIAPDLVSPIGGTMVSLPGVNPVLNLTWKTVPDAHTYSCVLFNLSNGRVAEFFMDAGDPAAEEFTFSLTGQQIVDNLGGGGNYEWRVWPLAPGHWADTSAHETFSLSFSKDGSDYYDHAQAIAKVRPGVDLPGSALLPTLSYFGLHSWRIMGISESGVISKPSNWSRFGIQCLGPAYGFEPFCGQTPPPITDF
ncbi:MAG: hypothetical protein HUU16_07615 [Candidatus Omnitrophica bacterium]|nr:hypothetical protein [Candidatus Omnitrophota bacterium]